MNLKNEFKNRFRILKGGLISLVVSTNLYSAPSGGTVVSGTANINQNGNTTNINQTSNKAIINWQNFSIANGETVNFNQPNVNSITLNRVIGNEKSIIDGALNANGQVWLVNQNGILFGKNAKVNTAGIIASTKDILNEDFLNGNYNFKGNSKASILNEGEIKSLEKTHATFIANSVINNGKIEVHKGTINLVGASDVTINLNDDQTVTYKVNKGVLNALVENNNLLVANGGQIYLTTNAKDELSKGVVNNSGIIEANSIEQLKGEVILFAYGGKANVSGTIEAKDGFVETSGDSVKVKDGAKIYAKNWLIDPTDFTIAASGGDMTGATLSSNLETASIEIQSTSGTVNTNGKGDIYVKDSITWDSDKTLTLNAQNDIHILDEITATNSDGKVSLIYGNDYNFGLDAIGGVSEFKGKINLKAGDNFSTKKGSAGAINWTVVTADNFYTILNADKSKNYTLGKDITLSGDNNWTAIGDNTNKFTGKFDGLGHTISNLKINQTSTDYQGLFGSINTSSIVKNIGLINADVRGKANIGTLVGNNLGIVENSYATGKVFGAGLTVGGLVGYNGTQATIIKNSYANVTVTGSSNNLGGLVAGNLGTIENSYATGDVTGSYNNVGGLAAYNNSVNAKIINSYATGKVTGKEFVGGLVGANGSTGGVIENSYATGKVIGEKSVGGLAGSNTKGTIKNSYATGNVTGTDTSVGGLVGKADENSHIEQSYSNSTVTGGFAVGGLIGHLAQSPHTVIDSYATGDVSGIDTVGGLIGYLAGSSVTNSYSTGEVTTTYAEGSPVVGGLIGRIGKGYGNPTTVTNSFYDKTKNSSLNGAGYVEEDSSVNATGIIGKTTEELQNIATFKSKDWNIVEDSTLEKSYPILAWQKDRNDYVWLIKGNSTPPNPTPPNPNNPSSPIKSDTQKEIEKLVDNIEQITNSTQIAVNNYIDSSFSNTGSGVSSQNSNLNINQNSNVIAINDRVGVEIINGGIKMPDNIGNSLNEDEDK